MQRGRLFFLGYAIFVVTSISATAQPLTKEALKAAYSGGRAITAEIEQSKSSPYLFKPLVSRVHLQMHDATVVWRVLEPVRGELVLENGRVSSDGAIALPPGSTERMAPLLRLLRAVFSVDFDVLAVDFDLTFSANEVEARARPTTQAPLIERLVIRFHPDLTPALVVVDAKDEHAELKFLSFASMPAPTVPSAP